MARLDDTDAQQSLANAELQLVQATMQTDASSTETGVSYDDIAVEQAQINLEMAQSELDDLLNWEPDEDEIALAEANLEAAQAALDDVRLLAPMDGTVIAVDASVGESVSGPIITLVDLEQPLLEVYLDETDLDKVGSGFEAEIVFDALPDDTFTGHVVQVDPLLSDANDVPVIRAVVQLDADFFAKPQTLPIGLNGTVEIISGRAENAVLVPVEALRELSPGEYAVFVMENGEPQLRIVEVGLMDFTFAEITSGLEASETVTTGIVETG